MSNNPSDSAINKLIKSVYLTEDEQMKAKEVLNVVFSLIECGITSYIEELIQLCEKEDVIVVEQLNSTILGAKDCMNIINYLREK